VNRRGRRSRLLVTAGSLAAVLLAGGTTVAALTRDGNAGGASPPPYPTDRMLIRGDTGGDNSPERRSNVFVLTPGSAAAPARRSSPRRAPARAIPTGIET
jgi:hypothetical protein